jgi:hypothetical protein
LKGQEQRDRAKRREDLVMRQSKLSNEC